MNRKAIKYGEAVKLKAVYEVETGELSSKGAARKYGCDPASIRSWRRKYGNERWRQRLKETHMGNEEQERVKKLEQELKTARMKLEIYEHMFDIAKEEMGIDLKKNYTTAALREQEKLDRSVPPVKPGK